MAVSKLVLFTLLCQAACSAAAEDRCASTSDEQEGRAMLQVSDSSMASPKKHTPKIHTAKKHSPKQHTHKAEGKTEGELSSIKKAKTPDASNVGLNQHGYKVIADMCCPYEMEEFIRRLVTNEDMKVCDEGGLQGIVPWHTCEQRQNYSVLLAEINEAGSGLCPWAAPKSEACKKVTKSCGQSMDPMSHRRRNCGRHDNSQSLDLAMQNAATNEFMDSVCGVHQQYQDIESKSGIMKMCEVDYGDFRANTTAIRSCLKECCATSKCIGISITKQVITLQRNFDDASEAAGSVSWLHRQR